MFGYVDEFVAMFVRNVTNKNTQQPNWDLICFTRMSSAEW